MNGTAFIRMMREDIETHKDKTALSSVGDVMEYVVKQNQGCDIDPSKNVEDCYKAIFEAAKKNACELAGNRGCCSTPDMSIAAVSEYLGITIKEIISAPVSAVSSGGGTGGTIALEDFL